MDFNYIGRFFFEDGVACYSWSSSRIEFSFIGSELLLDIESTGEEIFYNLYLNEEFFSTFSVPRGRHNIQVLKDLKPQCYRVSIERRNELFFGLSKFYGIQGSTNCKQNDFIPDKKPYIEFIGDSLSAGYGAESKAINEEFKGSTEDVRKSFAGIASSLLGVNYSVVAYSGKGAYRDYGGALEKNLPYYYSLVAEYPKVEWDFSIKPDLVVINLGANDFAVDIPVKEKFVDSYLSIVDQVINGYGGVPVVLIYGMEQKTENIPFHKEYIEEIYSILIKRNITAYKIYVPPKDPDITRGADDHPAYKQNLIYGNLVAKEVKPLIN